MCLDCGVRYPALCEDGAYPNTYSANDYDASPSRNVSKAVYTPAQLRELVAFAKSYGIRIQPEWDMPGHGAWGMGMPELMASACKDALDVTRPELYRPHPLPTHTHTHTHTHHNHTEPGILENT